MRVYSDLSKVLKTGKKILRQNPPSACDCSNCEIQLVESEAKLFSAVVVATCIFLGAVILLVASCQPAHAYTDQEAINVLVGEAADQGKIGMTCVGEVLRKHSSLKGFYGFKASHSAHEPKWVWKQAKKAWLASKTSNYTKHAQHFENIHAFGCPYWVKSCVETFRFKDHVFYKEVA